MSLEQPLGPMANYIKRLKGYLAPAAAVHGGGDPVPGPDRVERRDLQRRRRRLQKSKTTRSVEEERALKNASGGDPSFRKGYRVLMEPRHRPTTRIDANDGDSPEVLPTQKNDEEPSLGRHETKKRPTFKVEVEDWDALGKQEKNSTLANVSGKAADTNSALAHKTYQNAYQRLKKAKTSVEQRVGFHPSEVTYSLEYCDDVFDHLAVATPKICRRDLVMKGSLDYVEPSKYFLPFKNLADVSIYAAFLDHRGKEKVVRVIALGPQGRDGEKSVFECVFYRPVRISHDVRNKGILPLS
ncbi:hypothetical protein Btru_051734 [Bulinus truncatus]|nr:hypothetical protein Btru_051734 [Bulinus truncatus]